MTAEHSRPSAYFQSDSLDDARRRILPDPASAWLRVVSHEFAPVRDLNCASFVAERGSNARVMIVIEVIVASTATCTERDDNGVSTRVFFT